MTRHAFELLRAQQASVHAVSSENSGQGVWEVWGRTWCLPVSGEMYISMALRRPEIPMPKIMSADPMMPPEISRMVTCKSGPIV